MKGDIIDDYYKRPDAGRGSVPLQPIGELEEEVAGLKRKLNLAITSDQRGAVSLQEAHNANYKYVLKAEKLEEEIAALNSKLEESAERHAKAWGLVTERNDALGEEGNRLRGMVDRRDEQIVCLRADLEATADERDTVREENYALRNAQC